MNTTFWDVGTWLKTGIGPVAAFKNALVRAEALAEPVTAVPPRSAMGEFLGNLRAAPRQQLGERLLLLAARESAEELLLEPDQPPRMRLHGKVRVLDGPLLTSDQVGVWNWQRWASKDFDALHAQGMKALMIDLLKRPEVEQTIRRALLGTGLVDAVYGLWDIVNNLTRLRPSKRERYRVTIFGSARTQATKLEYQQAVEFARKIADAGFMVITGAGAGIMDRYPSLRMGILECGFGKFVFGGNAGQEQVVTGGRSFLLDTIRDLPEVRIMNIRYDEANRFGAARAQRLGTGVFVVCGQNAARGGIFDYWGCPATIRENVLTEIKNLITT